MTRRSAAAIIAGVVILALVMWLARSGPDEPQATGIDGQATELVETDPATTHLAAVAIYFPDSGGLLSAEERQITPWASAETGAQRVLETLIAGPEDGSLNAPLPAEVSLGPIYLSAASVLYVDLVSTTLSAPPSTGSQMELMSVYSLVNTLTLAIPEIKSVVLLWNGRQPLSFGGHVDTSLPLTTARDLIRTRR
jgi:hypothetical protein